MALGAVMIQNVRGDIIFSRAFRDGLNIRTLADAFRTQIIATKAADRSPVIVLGSVTFLHMRYDNLFVIALTRSNVNAALAFVFLSRFMFILSQYFGTVNEDSLKEHFVLAQELLDEVCDYGYPILTEVDVLKQYITSSGLPDAAVRDKGAGTSVTIQATGAIPWRAEGIKHRKNEVYVDVIEDCNLLMSQTGAVLSRDVAGKIVMKSFLSGMPECKLGLNDKLMAERSAAGRRATEIDLEDVTFHQCVKLNKFDADRTISFTPPDAEFVLMRYRTSDSVAPPFRVVSAQVSELGKTRIEIDFRIRADFNPRLFAQNVVVSVPVPPNTASSRTSVGLGKAKLEGSQRAVVWKISRIVGGTEARFSAELQLLSSTSDSLRWSRPPISLQFTIPMLACSGLFVRFLKVHELKLGYSAVKWVRYITKAGQYECRI